MTRYIAGEGLSKLAKKFYEYLQKVNAAHPKSWITKKRLWDLARGGQFSFETFQEACEQLDNSVEIGCIYKGGAQYKYYEMPFEDRLENFRKLEWFDSYQPKSQELPIEDEKPARIEFHGKKKLQFGMGAHEPIRQIEIINEPEIITTIIDGISVSHEAPRQTKKERMYAEQNGQCLYCDTVYSIEEMTFDHLIPRSRGGNHNRDNLVLACQPCNNRKADKLLSEWRPDLVDKINVDKGLQNI